MYKNFSPFNLLYQWKLHYMSAKMMVFHDNDIVDMILDTEFRHCLNATSYHPKMTIKVIFYS